MTEKEITGKPLLSDFHPQRGWAAILHFREAYALGIGVLVYSISYLVFYLYWYENCFPPLILALFFAFAPLIAGPVLLILVIVMSFLRKAALPQKQKLIRYGIISLLLLLNVADFLGFGSVKSAEEQGFRAGIESRIDLDQLQVWATKICEEKNRSLKQGIVNEFPSYKDYSTPRANEEQFPDDILKKYILPIKPVYVGFSADNDSYYIRFRWGGGFYSWGFIVGPPGIQPSEHEYQLINLWKPGIYGWHE